MVSPHARNNSGTTFSRRLGYYLIGVAIGLVALGFLMSNRQRAAGDGVGEMVPGEVGPGEVGPGEMP